ncbi:uncharacterized protein [Solanum lycopersicum]|uniref:uncharacterized protein n=1 Tax=Solanum lycopersicum TaxID=4081 RepID=UPI003748C407
MLSSGAGKANVVADALSRKSMGSLTDEIEIPTWKWDMINMVFITGLPRTQRKYDSIWVIVDRLTKSTHFHPVRTTYSAEDYARLYVREIDDHLPLIEFAYNNSYHSSIQMAPYEALYGRKCRSPIGWFDVGETKLIGPDMIQQVVDKVSPMKGMMRFGRKGKLSPRYIGPYKIVRTIGKVAYELDLPSDLEAVDRYNC